MRTSHLLAMLLTGAIGGMATVARAATLPVQGVLRNAAGGPVADGAYVLFAKLYASATATGNAYAWEDAIAGVKVRGGFFDAVLGANAAKPIPDALLMSGKPLWIGVHVGSDPELPRRRLVRVPGAWYARRAGTAGDLECAGCVGAGQLAPGAVTPSRTAFMFAGSKTKGGTALQAEHAAKSDVATEALRSQEAKHAAHADVATIATRARALECTGCVKLGHFDKAVSEAWLGRSGGTVTGDLAVAGKLTAVGGLVLGNSTISGGQLAATDTAKVKCAAAIAGRIAFDKPSGRLSLCDGKSWRKLAFCSESCRPAGTVPCGQPITDGCGDAAGCSGKGTYCDGAKTCDGGACKLIGKSCKELHAQGIVKSGVYLIDPDGPGGGVPFSTYCDMSSDGGGWTLLVRANGAAGTFRYSSPLWTDAKTLNPGLIGDDTKEVKTAAAITMPFTSLRIGLRTGSATRWLRINKAATSLTKLLSGGQVGTSLGRNAWKSLVPGASAQPRCNIEGFNRACGARRVRIGFLTNQENDCNSCDSYVGIGHSGQTGCENQKGTICGLMASCSADNGSKSIASWGYVFGR